jgi:hypothetical protein
MAFYEVLDMAECERTACLPFVNGDIAHFRHYVGVPLNPYGGPNVGTVFLFREKASDGSQSAAIHSYVSDIAVHITRHLEQAAEALQGQRTLRFNKAVASLLKRSLLLTLLSSSITASQLVEQRTSSLSYRNTMRLLSYAYISLRQP